MKASLIAVALVVSLPTLAEESPADIARKSRERGGLNLLDVTAELRLVTVDKNNERREQALVASAHRVNGRVHSLTRFLSPPGVAGVSVLTVEGSPGQADAVSMYLPKVHRVRKVASSQRGESFMDTDFNYADLANTGGAPDDSFRREADQKVDGRDCFVVSGQAGPESPYGTVRAFVDRETFVPLRVEYSDREGRPFKLYRAAKLKRFKDRVLASESVMQNLKTGSRTETTVVKLDDSHLGDDDFTERALERGVILAVALSVLVSQLDGGSVFPAFDSAEGTGAIESFAPTSTAITVRPFGEAKVLLGLDPQLYARSTDPFPVNVFDLRGKLRIGADVKLSDSVRLVLEGRALWRGVAEAGFAGAKAIFEPTLGETYVDLYSKHVDLRVGNQVLVLGANAAFAPEDLLSPRDLRWSFLQADPEDAKLPVFAAKATGELGPLEWAAILVPFFSPDVYSLFGQNESLLQPGSVGPLPLHVDPSIEDSIQPILAVTQRPYAPDVALRVATLLEKVKLGASWVWMNEKLPEVTVDPELASLLAASAQGQPLDPAAELSIENRLRAGEQLWTGVFERQHLFSLEASRIVGPSQLDLDLTFSPAQTFFTDAFEPVRKSTLSWTLGWTPAEDTKWIYGLSYVGLAAFGVHADELLFLIEPGTARGVERTAWLHLVFGTFGRKLLDDRLELSARGAFDVVQRSFVVGPRAAYRWRRLTFWASFELYDGTSYSPFGYFRRNSAAWLGATAELF